MSVEVKVLKNIFSQSNLKKVRQIIDLVNWKQSRDKIIQQIQSVSSSQYLWLIGDSPAYHLQYQNESVVILKVQDMAVIVWKPKYIQYPAIVKFPQFNNKKLKSLQLKVDEQRTIMSETLKNNLLEFIELFYGTFFHSDQNFQTNLVTYVKHYISKSSKLSYWHCAFDDDKKIQISHLNQSQSKIVINISGLLIFTYKGTKGGVLSIMKNKWIQVISFFAMLMIFIAAVSCDSEDRTGICIYKNQLMVGGAAVMMGLMGMRIANRKKTKKPKKQSKKQD